MAASSTDGRGWSWWTRRRGWWSSRRGRSAPSQPAGSGARRILATPRGHGDGVGGPDRAAAGPTACHGPARRRVPSRDAREDRRPRAFDQDRDPARFAEATSPTREDGCSPGRTPRFGDEGTAAELVLTSIAAMAAGSARARSAGRGASPCCRDLDLAGHECRDRREFALREGDGRS